jgi:hypothetical protein
MLFMIPVMWPIARVRLTGHIARFLKMANMNEVHDADATSPAAMGLVLSHASMIAVHFSNVVMLLLNAS